MTFKRIWRGAMAIKSVIFGVLILIAWGRSYFAADTIVRGGGTQYVQLSSARGTVMIRFVHDGQPTQLGVPWHRESSKDPDDVLKDGKLGDTPWNHVGFGWNSTRLTNALMVNIFVPHWLMFLLAMPSAILWIVRRQHSQSIQPVRAWCPRCMQEVVQNQAVCPQCGGQVAILAQRDLQKSIRCDSLREWVGHP